MPLATTYNNSNIDIGILHAFVSTDLDAIGTGGWRYLGLQGGEQATATRGDARMGVELDEIEGALLNDYAGPQSLSISQPLSVLSKMNLADTRPGSTSYLVAQNIVAVGIGRDRTVNLTNNLPAFLFIPEWCDLAAMFADATHADWSDATFVWRGLITEQGNISFAPNTVASTTIRVDATLAQTPPGMTQVLPADFRLYYQGNPKRVPVGHPLKAIADAMVLPNFSALLVDFAPADFIAEEFDAYWGDPFTANGMASLGRLRGARSVGFSTTVKPITHPRYGETPTGGTVSGAAASAEFAVMQIDLDLYARILNRTNKVTVGATTVGIGAGNAGMRKVSTANAILLRPVSASDASRDFILWHAVPQNMEEPFDRSTREMRLRFDGRFYNGTGNVPAGARVAMFGDAQAAGVNVTFNA